MGTLMEVNCLYKVTKLKRDSAKCPTHVHLILGPHDYITQMLLERWAYTTIKLSSRYLVRNRYTTYAIVFFKTENHTLLVFLLFNKKPTLFLEGGGENWLGRRMGELPGVKEGNNLHLERSVVNGSCSHPKGSNGTCKICAFHTYTLYLNSERNQCACRYVCI